MTINNTATSVDPFLYSQIINSFDYNRIMSEQHLYISASDHFLAETIAKETNNGNADVVELGCGPARILPLVRRYVPNARLTGVEADKIFAKDAVQIVANLNIDIITADVEYYRHHSPVDVFYSQGFHHHVAKEIKTKSYLQNIYDQLRHGGVYVLSDEFLPDYQTEVEREERAIVWYSHIVAHALLHGYTYLAQEEAKTLLDDLNEGCCDDHLKSVDQINHILLKAPIIDGLARKGRVDELTDAVHEMRTTLQGKRNLNAIGDDTIDLSRHDFKICHRVLMGEISATGFFLEDSKSFGPITSIGAMTVYLFRK